MQAPTYHPKPTSNSILPIRASSVPMNITHTVLLTFPVYNPSLPPHRRLDQCMYTITHMGEARRNMHRFHGSLTDFQSKMSHLPARNYANLLKIMKIIKIMKIMKIQILGSGSDASGCETI